MPTYLVTGVAGFIGSHLARTLLRSGHDVVGIDDFSTGQPERVADLQGLTLHRGDVYDRTLVSRAMRGVDFVLHHAAIASVPRCLEDPARSLRVNALATQVLLQAAHAAGVRRFVLASSSAAYGNANPSPVRESMPVDPLSPYAEHKVQSERFLQACMAECGLGCVVLRYFNVYGPQQSPQSEYAAVITKFVDHMLRGSPVTIYGDGEQSRDFTYVDDVVRANLLACEAPEAPGKVINVAGGQARSLNELVLVLNRLLGQRHAPCFAPPRAAEVRHSQADIGQARRILGFSPNIDLHQGLDKTVRWFQNSQVLGLA